MEMLFSPGFTGPGDLLEKYLCESDKKVKLLFVQMLLRMANSGNPQAKYIMACLVLDGLVHIADGEAEMHARSLLLSAASNGYRPAKTKLNAMCRDKYEETFRVKKNAASAQTGVLRDFNGEEIKIDRRGRAYPVEAALTYEEGRSVLTLYANVHWLFSEPVADMQRLNEAVLAGIREWSGVYRVFGNQLLEVRVELTQEKHRLRSVHVFAITDDVRKNLEGIYKRVPGNGKYIERARDMVKYRRSFASAGFFRWSVYGKKLIALQSDSGKFNEYEELQAVAKHEFGHALGLGDLYRDSGDFLPGVEIGTYPELDPYAAGECSYNLVMCNQCGPVSNNDIEMVVLAFRENRRQIYQPQLWMKNVSAALGRGN